MLSTGASSINDIENAINELTNIKNITLMQCTTAYPTKLIDINLNVLNNYKNLFRLDIGFSDHSKSILSPSLAVAIGASVIEKHFTINQNLIGPDHKASLNGKQLKQMIENIRETEKNYGYLSKKNF